MLILFGDYLIPIASVLAKIQKAKLPEVIFTTVSVKAL